MKKTDVKVGGVYLARVSGHFAAVRLDEVDVRKGWHGINLTTGSKLWILSAAKLRRSLTPEEVALLARHRERRLTAERNRREDERARYSAMAAAYAERSAERARDAQANLAEDVANGQV